MTRPMLAFLLFAGLALTADAALNKGNVAPDFSAQASLGGKTFDFSLSRTLKKGPVVLYFFPAAFTSECNVLAHDFAASHDKFAAAGATVVGVSMDSVDRLNAFSADPDYCGGKIAVAADVDGAIAKSYDLKVLEAPAGGRDTQGTPIAHPLVETITFIVQPDGRIAATVSGKSASANVAAALEVVRKLAPKQMAADAPAHP